MTTIKRLAALALLALAFGTATADDMPQSWDGLVQVKPKRMDAAYLLPGADFRSYTKLMVDPAEVAFAKNWLRSQNDSRNLSRQVTQEDAEKILAAARSNFDEIFVEAFTKAGYTIVQAPGPDVMRVSTGVLNLYVTAPDVPTAGRSTTYTTQAGEATLVIEVRDSTTNLLLGRVLDRRETQRSTMQMTTSVSNLAEFRTLFKAWAGIAVKGLQELKDHSPVPEDLKPKQKL
jgi:Protein of unknown function (DUF3313)